MTNRHPKKTTRLRELIGIFLKLGILGFGGPVAHIAMMEQEVVHRRNWITKEYFLDLVGATNLIPGPNSTEMAIHIGYIRAGWSGLVIAGMCFILPATLITAVFGWAYVKFGSLPKVAPFLSGIKPTVLAVMLFGLWRLGKTAVKSWQLSVIGMCVLIVSLLKVDEVAALLGGGLIGMIWLRLSPQGKTSHSKKTIIELACISIGAMLSETRISAETGAMMAVGVGGLVAFSLSKLGFFFLKVGAVLFGGGFVLVAFLEGGLVHDYGWLSQQQLLDAIAIGQFTPGPILSTATFIGYLLSGIPGALVATIAIFFPSFFFVAALNPVVPRLRQSSWTSAFLDAVNVSSVALMLAVTVKLSQTALVSWSNWAIAVAAVGAIFLWKLNGFWLILGGATLGWLLSALGLT